MLMNFRSIILRIDLWLAYKRRKRLRIKHGYVRVWRRA